MQGISDGLSFQWLVVIFSNYLIFMLTLRWEEIATRHISVLWDAENANKKVMEVLLGPVALSLIFFAYLL